MRVWDTLDGDLLCSFPAAAGNKIYFSDDGRKVWVWNDQGRTWWDVVTGKASDEANVADDLRPPYRLNMTDSDIVSFEFTKGGKLSLKRVIDYGSPLLAGERLYELTRHAGTCLIDWTKWSPNVFFEMGVMFNDLRSAAHLFSILPFMSYR